MKLNIAFLLLLTYLPLSAATWKVFFYMDSSDALSDMAIKNITDMVRGKPNDTVDFIIQMHAYFNAGLRYKVTSEGLMFLDEVTLSGDGKQDFIDAARWAFTDNQSDYTMLIMSNHGYGILDPYWNEETQKWETYTDAFCETCSLKRSHNAKWAELHKRHKGFIFNNISHTYLNNQDLIDSFEFIKNNVLNGKQIDIIAFDTCMGDMFEVGYQLAPYAHYLVGNQSCSLVDGFDYQGIMPVLNQGLDPRSVAAGMVTTFDAYYTKNDSSGIYTHAALDLAEIKTATQALDDLIINLLALPDIAPLLIQATDASPRFCMWPMYTDLITFCKRLEEQLAEAQTYDISTISPALQNFYTAMQQLIVAHCGGFTTRGLAHGVAIYLPSGVIDNSYFSTLFARESQWINMLKTMVDNRSVVIE